MIRSGDCDAPQGCRLHPIVLQPRSDRGGACRGPPPNRRRSTDHPDLREEHRRRKRLRLQSGRSGSRNHDAPVRPGRRRIDGRVAGLRHRDRRLGDGALLARTDLEFLSLSPLRAYQLLLGLFSFNNLLLQHHIGTLQILGRLPHFLFQHVVQL